MPYGCHGAASQADYERLQTAFDRATRFSANAFRELESSISTIRTAANLARNRPHGEAERTRVLEQIQAETERTSSLLNDLIYLAEADAGASQIEMKTLDLVECARAACIQGRDEAQSNHLFFEANLPAHPIPVTGDFAALRRLLLALIDNAVKYTPRGGWVSVSVDNQNGRPTVNVRDTGIGIGLQDLPHIFERFYRGEQALSRNPGGTGLGLPIAQCIAIQHGGQILAESLEKHGANFRLSLPSE